jgi:hypothetical protein
MLDGSERVAEPSEAFQAAGVPGSQNGPMLELLLVALFALSLHALVTGRTLSPSVQARGPRTVRVLGGVGLVFAIVGFVLDQTHVLATVPVGPR